MARKVSLEEMTKQKAKCLERAAELEKSINAELAKRDANVLKELKKAWEKDIRIPWEEMSNHIGDMFSEYMSAHEFSATVTNGTGTKCTTDESEDGTLRTDSTDDDADISPDDETDAIDLE